MAKLSFKRFKEVQKFAIDKTNATTINISPEEGREVITHLFNTANVFDIVTLYENIKGGDAIPLLNAPISFVKSDACGFVDTTSIILTDLVLTPAKMKAGTTICPESLNKTAFERYLPDGAEVEELSNEEIWINYIIGRLKEEITRQVIAGDSTNTNEIDGIVTKGLASTAAIPVTAGTITSSNAIAELFKIYAAMPAAVTTPDARPVILINNKWLNLAVINSYNNNNFLNSIKDDGSNAFVLPGTNVLVKAFPWIPDNRAIATSSYYLAVGTDLESDFTELDYWYSKDDRVIKVYAGLRLATGIAFQNQMVKYA